MYLIVSADSPRPFGVVPASLTLHLTPELLAQLSSVQDAALLFAAPVIGVDLRATVEIGGQSPRRETPDAPAWTITTEPPTVWSSVHLNSTDQTGIRVEGRTLRLMVWNAEGHVRLHTGRVKLSDVLGVVQGTDQIQAAS